MIKEKLTKLIENINKKHLIIGVIIAVASIIIDQVTKALAVTHLKSGSVTIIKNFFELRLHYNNGAAWSSFAGEFGFLMLITFISIVIFTYLFLSVDFKKKIFYSLGITLMFGGLFGNMIDRIFQDGNYVIDFLAFEFGSYSFPIFNIADVCLVVGVVLFMIDILFLEEKRKRNVENEEV